MSDKLTEIMAWKRREIAPLIRPVSETELALLSATLPRPPSFATALRRSDGKLAIIAEIKRRSPSAGDIKAGANATDQARRYQSAGAEVWAVEKDRNLHLHLEESVLPHAANRLHLLEGDAVEQPLAGLPSARAATGFKVVANLPYAISTPWMDAVLSGRLPDRMVLMLQQEAAQRYAAAPGGKQFGAISVFLQAAYDVAPGHKVDSACFYPKPDIESYLLVLVRKSSPHVFPPAVKTLIRACFQQRRKQIGGWIAQLTAAGLSGQTRAEAIPVELWRKLAV